MGGCQRPDPPHICGEATDSKVNSETKKKTKILENTGPGGLGEAGRLGTQKTEHSPRQATPPCPNVLGPKLRVRTSGKGGRRGTRQAW